MCFVIVMGLFGVVCFGVMFRVYMLYRVMFVWFYVCFFGGMYCSVGGFFGVWGVCGLV